MARETKVLVTAADEPRLDTTLDNYVLVCGVPQATADKVPKLRKVLQKAFGELAVENMELAQDDEGTCKGFAFLQFANRDEAMRAQKALHNFQMDKNHTLRTIILSDFDTIVNTPDEFVPPTFKPYDEEKDNLFGWLMNEQCYDQFFVSHGHTLTVATNTPDSYMVAQSRDQWGLGLPVWSPRGTYLVTRHREGAAIWGTPQWKRLKKFDHPGVLAVDVSPQENFLVTLSEAAAPRPEDANFVVIWDIKTGARRRGFKREGVTGGWPFFLWSHDDKYFARCGENTISIYDSSTMKKLQNASYAVPRVKTIRWSPSDNILTFWTPEEGDKPGSVVLLRVPDLKELRTRQVQGLVDAELFWHPDGDFLAARTDRLGAKGKTVTTDLLVFQMREADCPVQMCQMSVRDIEKREYVLAIFWEPRGKRFAALEGTKERLTVRIYELGAVKPEVVGTVDGSFNFVSWSPQGQNFVVATAGGVLEFYTLSSGTPSRMAQREHAGLTGMTWDPTGRYFVTMLANRPLDNGYMIWSLSGEPLQRHIIDGFHGFLWRPRPPSLLKAEDLKQIEKEKDVYERKFQAEDTFRRSKASQELIEKRRQMRAEWNQMLESIQKHMEEIKPQLQAMRPHAIDEPIEEETTEEVVLRYEVKIIQ